MTGQTVAPEALSAAISSTRARTRASITPNTSRTDRPDASIRARSAALISRMAAGRSSGAVSQCGSSFCGSGRA